MDVDEELRQLPPNRVARGGRGRGSMDATAGGIGVAKNIFERRGAMTWSSNRHPARPGVAPGPIGLRRALGTSALDLILKD
jgi:hypothetical protein